MTPGEIVRTYWPVVVVAGSGLLAFGALSSNVQQLQKRDAEVKQELTQQRASNATDHDLLIQLNAKQTQTTEAVNELKSDIRELARTVRRSVGRDPSSGHGPSP